MSDYRFETIEGDLEPRDKEVMVAGMLDYHAKSGHPRRVDTHSILIRNAADTLIGCVIVTFLYNGMEIATLWVDEKMRGQGLGQKLMEMAEAEGKKRGATFAYTNTFTWQAPDFYAKLGYTMYGKLEDFPAGNELSYWRKSLI